MSQTATYTQTAAIPAILELKVSGSLPQKLDNRFDKYPKLSREQCGHLRHFHNIASSLDGDWPFMGSQEPGQEWDTAYRYQLATMTYAAGAAHYHCLPAMRSVFKGLIRKLINKMLRREVWGYWYLTSQSGIRVNPNLKELRKPWADPVCKENIMYSGHLLLMVSLYTMLFADDTFDQKDSIVFNWNPMFWGFGPEKFSYTRSTLQEAIIKEMEREKWMGVCCEPNLIFIICNQFPLIAMRYNDVVNGTKVLDEVLPKYKAAWAAKQGFVGNNGMFRRAYLSEQGKAIESDDISHTVWAMAFMPWNYDLVHSMYPSAGYGYLQRVDDRLNLNPQTVANKIRALIKDDGADPNAKSTLTRARELTADSPLTTKPYMSPTFGYLALWISEIAGGSDLDALLQHADKYLNPSWSNGGLYYARCENGWDVDGNFIFNDAFTGNAGIGYGRLNVKNGQKKMWDRPWTKGEVESRPYIDGLGLESNVDCLRGIWDEQEGAMVVTLRTWNGSTKAVELLVNALPTGHYGIYVNGELREVADVGSTMKSLPVQVEVDGNGVNLIVIHE